MTVGYAIRALRASAGFTQKTFAEQLEISPTYLSLIERDRREPTLRLLRRMAKHLGFPATVLFAVALGSSDRAQADPRELALIGDLVNATRLNLLSERFQETGGKAVP
jgi:XRE family transcriptional regulator, regulator of sulfur utilization